MIVSGSLPESDFWPVHFRILGEQRCVVSVNCQRQISHNKTSGEQLNFTCSVSA